MQLTAGRLDTIAIQIVGRLLNLEFFERGYMGAGWVRVIELLN